MAHGFLTIERAPIIVQASASDTAPPATTSR
jgi:hypothetical protein